MYLDRNGDVRRFTPRQRAQDRWAGFVDGIKKRRFDHFTDHGIANYVEHLVRANGGR
jgi:triacylglycerol lipase